MSPMPQQVTGALSLRRIFTLGLTVGLVLTIVGAGFWSFEDIGANDILVVQSPWEGNLTWHVTPGVKWQGFGSTGFYKKRAIYAFDTPIDEEIIVKGPDSKDVKIKRQSCSNGIAVQFNEGGHGKMCGSIQYDMPLDIVNLNKIHAKFGSQEAVQRQIIETMMGKSVYLSGPLMSSRESYAEKRNDLIFHVEDQVQNGVYKTRQKEVRTKDQISQQDKTVVVVDIVKGPDGKPERQEESVLNDFGIKAFAFAIKRLPYDATVEQQIMQQQQIAMEVQTSRADALKAEQRTLTVVEQGKADAAQAKWAQEKVNATLIAEAEQKRTVAKLKAEAAEQYKREQILIGQGDAENKRLVMEADGALAAKIAAAVQMNKDWTLAFKEVGGNLVPQIVFGPNGGGQGSPNAMTTMQEMMTLITADAAKRLALDLGLPPVRPNRPRPTSDEGPVSSPAEQKPAPVRRGR